MPGKEWPVVEEGHRALVLEHHMCRLVPGDDLAEAAIRIRRHSGSLFVESLPSEAVRSGPMSRKAVRTLLIATALASVLLLGPGAADAGVAVKTGKYKGSTTQQAVSSTFRKIQFSVKKGKVTLTQEPS